MGAREQAEAEMTRGLTDDQVETFRACLQQVMKNLGVDVRPNPSR